MTFPPVPAWALRRLSRRPETWLLLVCLGALAPVLMLLAPLSSTPDPAWLLSMVRAWSLFVAVLGGSLALSPLRSIDEMLTRLRPLQRILVEACNVLTIVLVLHGLLLTGAWTASGGSFPVGATFLLADILILDLQVAMLCVVILRARLPRAPSIALLVVLTWVLPGILEQTSKTWYPMLRVAQTLIEFPSDRGSGHPWSSLAAGLRTSVGLGLATWLILLRPQPVTTASQ